MTGVVNVQASTGTPTPTPRSTPTSDSQPTEVRELRMAASTFCTKRGRRCRHPGVKVQIDLSQPATVNGTLTRRAAKRFGRVDFGTVAAGPRTLSFVRNAAGGRLPAARYKLKLTIAEDPPRTLRFKVR